MKTFIPQSKKITVALLFLALLYAGNLSAQKVAAASGNWSNPAIWSPSGVPSSTDAVTIASGFTVTVDISNAVCSSLQLGGSSAGAFGVLTFVATGSPKVTVTNATTVGGTGSTNTNRRGEIAFVSGSTFETGTLILNQGAANNPAVLTMSQGCLLRTGPISLGGGIVTYTAGGTIDMKATNTFPSTTLTTVNNLIISAGTTTFSAATTINGDLDIKAGAVLNLGTFTHPAKGLQFNDVQQIAGQWGYSGATNNNTVYFANTSGRVNVSGRFYSTGSNAPNLTSSWRANRDGTGASPTNFTTAGQDFNIQNGHNMLTTNTWTVSGATTKVLIESGGTLQSDHTTTLSATTTFEIESGGTYIQNVALPMATSILQGIEVFGPNSNYEVRVVPTGVSTPSAPGYGNLTINVTTGASNHGWSGAILAVQKDFTVLATGTGTTRHALCASAGNIVVTVGGNFILSGGNFWFSSGSSTCTMNVAGNLQISGASTVLDIANSTGVGTLNIAGNFVHTGGTVTEGGSTTTSTIFMNGSSAQTMESTGFTNTMNFTVAPAGSGTVEVPAGKTFAVAGSTLLTISNTSSATELTVNGTLNRTSSVAPVPNGSLVFGAGGTYVSNFATSTIPTASWNASSTLQIDASIADNEFTESFGNVLVNGASSFNMVTGATSPIIQGNLTMSTTGTVGVATLSASTLTINGNFVMNANGTLILDNANGNTNITKRIIVNGNYTQSAGTVNLSGSTDATIAANTRNAQIDVFGNFSHTGGSITETATDTDMITRINLLGTVSRTFESTGQTGQVEVVLNKTGTPNGTNNLVTLSASSRIDYNLTLTAGLLTVPNTMHLALGSAATITGTPSSTRMIVATAGEVRRMLGANPASSSFTFPIGDNTGTVEYSPVTVVFSGTGASGGYVSAKVINAKHPNNANTNNHLTRYWTIGQSGYTSPTAIVNATYNDADVVGAEASVLMGRWTGAMPWTRINSSINTVTNVLTTIIAGVLGDFSGINSVNPTVTATGGGVTVCKNTVVNLGSAPVGDGPFTYSWTGSITGSTTSATATANTSANGGPNSYTVTVTDGNGFSSAASSPVTVTVSAGTNTWSGSSWSNGTPPAMGGTRELVFSAGFTSTGSLSGCSCTVTSGAVVLASGHNMTLNNELTVSGGSFTVQNNANLVQINDVTNSGNISVVRNTAALMRQDYVMWGAPVSGQQLQAFSPQTLSNRFYTYNSATDTYAAVSASGNFNVGSGYLIRVPNNHPVTPTIWTGTFSGVPNNGTVTLSSLTANKYYSIGNPFPSTIDANTFITSNSLAEAVYFWRKTNNAATSSYATYTLAGGVSNSGGDPLGLIPNGFIQVGQGFIAKVPTGASSLSFTNGMRVANNGNQFLRSAQFERHRYWLNLTDNTGFFGQMMVAYMTGATNGYDPAIDGLFFGDSQTALTSIVENQEYVIQGRAIPFQTSDVVTLGFKSELGGDYTIALNSFDGLFETENQAIYLKDNLTNSLTNLKSGSYGFSTTAGVFNNRFEVVYENTLGIEQAGSSSNSVAVYQQTNEIVVHSALVKLASVQLYDIRGRLLMSGDHLNTNEVRLDAGTAQQVLIVKVTTANGEVISKKVIN